jgi:hypothetical protein
METVDYLMEQTFALSTKAWIFCCQNVLPNKLLCDLLVANMIDFTRLVADINDKDFRELRYWEPNEAHLNTIPERNTFFASVKKWAEIVLCSKYCKLVRHGDDDKRLGLCAAEQMYDTLIVEHLYGLLQPLTPKQYETLRKVEGVQHKCCDTLIAFPDHVKAEHRYYLIYGPLALVNKAKSSGPYSPFHLTAKPPSDSEAMSTRLVDYPMFESPNIVWHVGMVQSVNLVNVPSSFRSAHHHHTAGQEIFVFFDTVSVNAGKKAAKHTASNKAPTAQAKPKDSSAAATGHRSSNAPAVPVKHEGSALGHSSQMEPRVFHRDSAAGYSSQLAPPAPRHSTAHLVDALGFIEQYGSDSEEDNPYKVARREGDAEEKVVESSGGELAFCMWL